LTEALVLARAGSWERGFLLVQRANANRRTRQLEQAVADATAAHTPLARYGDAWLAQGMALMDAGRPEEAVRVFETLLRADYDFPHIGYWMLAAHARSRRYAAGPVSQGFHVGDRVRFIANQPGFWNVGDTAEVLGLGSPLGPILIKLDKEERTIHCEGTHFDKARTHTPTSHLVSPTPCRYHRDHRPRRCGFL
jgi:tetratricopeptide (TPR) repeat protein